MTRTARARAVWVVPAFITCSLALAPAYAGDKEDIAAANAKVEKAVSAGDADTLASLYTDDAILMPPGSPMVTGKDNIASVWQSMFEMGVSELDLQPTEVNVTGDTAAEVGTFTYTAGDMTGTGKYIVLWQKGDDGNWRLRRDIWNEDAPPPQ